MMRFHGAVASLLATILVVPAAVLPPDEVSSLERALERTVRSIEVLVGIQERLEDDRAGAVELARAASEEPLPDPRRRDERLARLRNEVNLLRMELDLAEAPSSLSGAMFPDPIPPPEGAPWTLRPAAELVPPSRGLDEKTRELMRAFRPKPVVPRPDPQEEAPEEARPEAFELVSADPVGEARAAALAGSHAHGLELLRSVEGDPQALYWKARCLEGLGRIDEAIETMRRSLPLFGEDPQAEQVRSDLEFLAWKRSFLERLPEGVGSKKAGSDAGGGR